MKKLLVFLILFAAVLTGCTQPETAPVAATTLPVWEFTQRLCEGTGISVARLVTENVSCLHDYTVQVPQMQTVEAADMVVCSGAGLESFLEDILHEAKKVDASAGIPLLCGHEHHGHTSEEHHHEHDPHIWLSPENAKQMCRTICGELSSRYPEHAELFYRNLESLLIDLDKLQAYGEATLKELSCRDLITFHDGFAYFAQSYDLHILKVVEEESGGEASAKELIELIHLVHENHLPAVFTEINGSTAAADIIAAETGVSVYHLDMAMAGGSYFEAMYHNIDTIKEALG